MQRIAYEQWMRQVSQEIISKCGMTADDIDDWCYTNDYEEGMSSKRSAARAIRNARALAVSLCQYQSQALRQLYFLGFEAGIRRNDNAIA